MCLAVPGRVVSLEGASGVVDVAGVAVQVRMDFVPDVTEGQYVLVHAGFAVTSVDEQEASDTLRLLQEAGRGGQGTAGGT